CARDYGSSYDAMDYW
nr:immunoglobulin heavy chain junction region [Mus musculus]